MDNIYIVKNKINILGIYDNLDSALDFIYSCVQNKLIKINDKIFILVYKINTSIILEEIDINIAYQITKKTSYNYEECKIIQTLEYESDSNSESDSEFKLSINSVEKKENKKNILNEYNEIGQQQIMLNHNINLLKKEKEQYEEELNVYENDLSLYKLFKEQNTEIPFLFEKKYKIFKHLDNLNKISFDNFILLYNKENISTSYDSLFIENSPYPYNIIEDDIVESFNDLSTDEIKSLL